MIYNREDEHERIKKFFIPRIQSGKSGLMYLCGHPGTGKTSSLNYILRELREEGMNFQPLMFNAMTYPDVRSFGITLHKNLHQLCFGVEPVRRLDRDDINDEERACAIEKLIDRANSAV